MKQLLILSGKGGTGKTTLASAFIRLSRAKAYADCDVDAPNLHLVSRPRRAPQTDDYYGLPKAAIDAGLCTKCDKCLENCRFDAISFKDKYIVDPIKCEGCGVCALVCPVGAVALSPAVAGELRLYRSSDELFSTAELKMGSGTSGKLVAAVKKRLARAEKVARMAIIDGSPGIGCPVIASLSGADMVLIVAEPSVTGISDMERIIKTASGFDIKIAVCVNKFDINPDNTEKIQVFCETRGLDFLGKVPFDPMAAHALNSGRAIVDISCKSGEAVRIIYKKAMRLLFEGGEGKNDY